MLHGKDNLKQLNPFGVKVKEEAKVGKKTLWDKMEKIKPTLKSQTAYKNYRISGGEASFEQWTKENKK